MEISFGGLSQRHISNDPYCTATVTMLSDLESMNDSTLSHFQGQMYQYNSDAREDVVVSISQPYQNFTFTDRCSVY